MTSYVHAHENLYRTYNRAILKNHNEADPGTNLLSLNTGATYRLRISNVGIKTTLNFRIQGHKMLLVETEGSYTLKQYYDSLDIHVGQSYSVLVTADQPPSTSYYIVASSRFVELDLFGVAIINYDDGSNKKPSGGIPEGPSPFDYNYSMEQARSIRSELLCASSYSFLTYLSSSFTWWSSQVGSKSWGCSSEPARLVPLRSHQHLSDDRLAKWRSHDRWPDSVRYKRRVVRVPRHAFEAGWLLRNSRRVHGRWSPRRAQRPQADTRHTGGRRRLQKLRRDNLSEQWVVDSVMASGWLQFLRRRVRFLFLHDAYCYLGRLMRSNNA